MKPAIPLALLTLCAVLVFDATAEASPRDSVVGVTARRNMQFNFQGRQMNRSFQVRQAGVVVGDGLVLTASLGDEAENVRIFLGGETSAIDADVVDSDEAFTLLRVEGLDRKPVKFSEAWSPNSGDVLTWHGVLGGRMGGWSIVSKAATADAVLDDGRRVYSDPPFRGPVLMAGALITDAQGRAVGLVGMVQNEDAGGGGRRGGRRMRRPGGGTPFVRPVRAFAHFLSGTVAKRGVLGVEGETLGDDVAAALGMKGKQGVLVTRVVPGSGAANAGLEAQQVIVSVAGKPTPNAVSMQRVLRGLAAGAKVHVEVMAVTVEGLKTKKVEVTLGAPEESTEKQRERVRRFGFTVEPLTDAMRRDRGLPSDTKGVSVRRVNPGGPAAIASPERLRRGDVILRIDNTDVPSVEKFREAMEAKKNENKISFFVQRGTETRFVELKSEPR